MAAGSGPDLGRVFADAAGEDERVEPAEGGGERPELAADAVDEEVDGLFRRRASLASRARISLETPETPRKPERS